MRKGDPTKPAAAPIVSPPRRRRGRPPFTPGEIKRYPLSLYVTKALKDALIEAGKASGRPLTQEIEARLLRTLDEDRGKDPKERGLENLMAEVMNLVRAYMNASGVGAIDTPDHVIFDKQTLAEHGLKVETKAVPHANAVDNQPDGGREAGGQPRRALYAEYGEPGQPGRLLPVEVSVERGDDGSVVFVRHHGGQVIAETPLTIDEAKQFGRKLLAAAGHDQKELPTLVEPEQRPKRRRAR